MADNDEILEEVENIIPSTRIEQYLAKLCGFDVDIPDEPLSRVEHYLNELIKNGGINNGSENSGSVDTPMVCLLTVTGGYNGGTKIQCKIDNEELITAIGSSPYNLAYTPSTASKEINDKTFTININPLSDSKQPLNISLSSGSNTIKEWSVYPDGNNSSFGYSYTDVIFI